MLRLIKCGLRVFFRQNRLTWAVMSFCILIGTVSGFFGCEEYEYLRYKVHWGIMLSYLALALLAVLTASVFTLQRDFTDGAVRNKTVFGYTKAMICCAWFIDAAVYAAVCTVLYLVPFFVFTRKALCVLPQSSVCELFLTVLMLFVSVALIGSIIILLLRRRAAALIVSVMLVFLLCIGAGVLTNRLREVEYYEAGDNYRYQPEKDAYCYSPVTVYTVYRNPESVQEPLRTVYLVLNKLNPAEAAIGITTVLDTIINDSQKDLEESISYTEQYIALRKSAEMPDDDPDTLADAVDHLIDLHSELNGIIDEQKALGGKPRVMLAVMAGFCALGTARFRKKDII